MSHNCDHIRQRALKHGEGSVEYEVWVRHSRHCPECRNELYIQGLLRNDSRDNISNHLSGNDISRLVQLADERYRGGCRKRRRFFLHALLWSARVAGFAVLLFFLYGLFPQEEVAQSPQSLARLSRAEREAAQSHVSPVVSSTEDSTPSHGTTVTASNDVADSSKSLAELAMSANIPLDGTHVEGRLPVSFIALASTSVSAETKVSGSAASDVYYDDPEMFPEWDVNDAVQGIRRRISQQRDVFSDCLDPDVHSAF